MRDVSNEVRVLRSDVNKLLKSRKASETSQQETEERMTRVAARLETVEQTIIIHAATRAMPDPEDVLQSLLQAKERKLPK